MCACGVEALGNGCGEEKGYVAGLVFLALRAGAEEERAIARVEGCIIVGLTLDVLHLVL